MERRHRRTWQVLIQPLHETAKLTPPSSRHAVRRRHIPPHHDLRRNIPKPSAIREIRFENVSPERVQQWRALSGHFAEPVESDVRCHGDLDECAESVERSESGKVSVVARGRELWLTRTRSPANAEAAQLFRDNMKEYIRRVRVSFLLSSLFSHSDYLLSALVMSSPAYRGRIVGR